MAEKICSHQVEELLDTYIADRNSFLIDRARKAYQKFGRGVMFLNLSEAAFADEARAAEMKTEVHYRYLCGDDLKDIPEDGRAMLDGYDPERECVVVGAVALDGQEPTFAVRVAKLASPVMELIRERGDEIFEMAKAEYRKQGRGLILFLPAPAEMGVGYGAMYVSRGCGHPIFEDDPDATLLVDGYSPEKEICYIAIEPDRGSSAGRLTFGGEEPTPIPGFTDHEDTAQFRAGRFANLPPKPTAHDAIFGGKPKKESSH